MSIEGSETRQQVPPESAKDAISSESMTTMDRLQFLEKQYNRLSDLFHDYLAVPPDDYSEKPIAHPSPSIPACEITRISSAEWRARQGGSGPGKKYSLLTVGRKGRGESSLRSQAVEVQSEGGKSAIETSAELTKTSEFTDDKAYRLILNGRSELMEVLGGIFDFNANMSAFYIWMWPFKQLVRYGDKVRARLAIEESKLKTENTSPGSPKFYGDGGMIPERGDLQPYCDTHFKSSPFTKENIKQSDDETRHQKTEDGRNAREYKTNMIEPHSMDFEHDPKSEGEARSNSTDPPLQNVEEGVETKEKAANTTHEPLQTPEMRLEADDPTRLRDELRCIVEFMDHDMKNTFSTQRSIQEGTKKTIAFDYLWLLFKPGDVVISAGQQKRAYIVLHVTGGRALERKAKTTGSRDKPREVSNYAIKEQEQEKEAYLAKYSKTTPFVIDCFYVDFDGKNFGPLPQKFMLAEFEGEKPITSLEVFPLRFDDNPKNTERLLAKRGKRFAKLARVDHKYYSGKTVTEPKILENQGEVHGEIMIDFSLAIDHFQNNYQYRRDIWDFKFGTGVIANPTLPDEREEGGCVSVFTESNADFKPTFLMEDSAFDNDLRTDFTDKTTLLEERPYSEKLPNEILMLLPPRVYGFSLLDRKWYAFDITKVDDIKDSGHGFEHLVLSKGHKKIVQALVQHHTQGPALARAQARTIEQDFSMDVVRGKDQGLIILLHGVPGVGKTSTAECVAAQTKRPLFPITCGDIGTTPEDVERRLNEYFDMAHKWGCVLLLDEAVFLGKREKGGDLLRNGVVSVFLRVLEYYSGILILTTNRIGEFDEAFSSRVHIKLYYPKLDRKSTMEIWKMNLRRIAESHLDITIEEDQIKKFAKRMWADSADKQTQRWNGRQIRNAFQSAIALAKWDHREGGINDEGRPILSVRQFEVVAQTSSHFDNYISTMHGIEEANDTWETIAARELLRKNDTPRKPISRATPVSRARGGRKKVETDEEEEPDSDSDENEEEMKKLKAKLDKLEKKKGPSSKKAREDNVTKKSLKVAPQPEKKDEELSSASDESD